MDSQDEKFITALISKMEQKRDNLLRELEEVQKWLTSMESIISQGKVIVGETNIGKASDIPIEIPTKDHVEAEPPEAKVGRVLNLLKPDVQKPHAAKCKQLLEESGGPLSLAQLDVLFDKRSWPIKGDNRRLVIYNSMRRNSEGKGKDWFVKAGVKKWGLKGRDDQKDPESSSLLRV